MRKQLFFQSNVAEVKQQKRRKSLEQKTLEKIQEVFNRPSAAERLPASTQPQSVERWWMIAPVTSLGTLLKPACEQHQATVGSNTPLCQVGQAA